MYFTNQQSFIEIILVKYASFNLLHNDNHMITRCDRARIEAITAFLSQSSSVKYL